MKDPGDILAILGRAEACPFAPSPTAQALLEARYLRRDAQGRVTESPEAMLRRVAGHVAGAEESYGSEPELWAEVFFGLMCRREFLPNSPTLMNAGTDVGQLAACFVLPVEGRLEEAVREMIVVQQTGGGTGFDFSGALEEDPVAAIEVFDRATDTVRQVGLRRGANLAALRVDHPAVVDFVTAKAAAGRLENFNLSLSVPDTFMEAAERRAEFPLKDASGKVVGRLRADKLLGLAAAFAWATGEPGLLFIDRINEANPTPELGAIRSTNPCGELPLLDYEACNLGSVNLARFVVGDDIDWDRLGLVVAAAVRFLDDVIDTSQYPLAEIGQRTRQTRKIGLGVMGFADMLVELDVPYDSDEAVRWADRVMAFVAARSLEASEELARERGPFPAFDRSRFAAQGLPPRRNATLNAVAPTGSISILAGCSSSIEPIFALAYERRVLEGRTFRELHPLLEDKVRQAGLDWQEVRSHVLRTGTLQGLDSVAGRLRDVFRTAHEIPWQRHLEIQAAFQRHTDNSVSKTINFPRHAPPDDVLEAFRRAFRLGVKGVTVYRDGSRPAQVLARGWHARRPRSRLDSAGGGTSRCPDCGGPVRTEAGVTYCKRCAWHEVARGP